MSARARSDAADIYRPEPATIVRRERLTELELLIELRLDSGRELGHRPGQFVELSVAGAGEAPLSVSSSPTRRGSFELVVRRVGTLTGALHRLADGDQVGIRGPFGTPFPVEGALRRQDVLFVCGGIGLVPVRSAIQYVLDKRSRYGAVTIVYGTKSPADRLFRGETEAWGRMPGVTYQETVDRAETGWPGHVGVITTLLPALALRPDRTVAVICGPPIMYKFVLIELQGKGLGADRMYVSLERHMKCGVGKCGHCQINGCYVCQDGPVFRYRDLGPLPEAFR